MIWQNPTFWHPSNKMQPLWVKFFLTIYTQKMMVLILLLPTKVAYKIEQHWKFISAENVKIEACI
jgi:hypothetical protein